jgi:biopolymer transport protein TolQ
MHAQFALWSYFLHTSFPIQCIFVLLAIASLVTWLFIIQRLLFLRSLNKAYLKFEKEFWSDIKLTTLYEELPDSIAPEYISAIFYAGFTEFCRLRNSGCQTLRVLLEGVARAMRIAQAQAEIYLERQLHWLAIIASSTPYLGLMGTLLGIITALGTLSSAGPNALLVLAPGLAEALIISVMSLLAALPALAFYHYYTAQIDKLLNQYHTFQDEFIELLLRQAYEEQHEKLPST